MSKLNLENPVAEYVYLRRRQPDAASSVAIANGGASGINRDGLFGLSGLYEVCMGPLNRRNRQEASFRFFHLRQEEKRAAK